MLEVDIESGAQRQQLKSMVFVIFDVEQSLDPDFDAGGLKDELRRRGFAAALEALLEDPVIKIHRAAGPAASDDELRAKWREAMKALKAAALDVELGAVSGSDDYSDEAMKHRLKLKRASLNDVGD